MTALATPAAPARLTPNDLLAMPNEGMGFELVDGKLVELNVSFLSSFVAGEIHGHLRQHVKPNRLGWVTPEGTSFRCFPQSPNKVRRADTSFIRLDRLSAEQALSGGHCLIVPDLVVEVISPDDRSDDVNGKRIEWLQAGAQLVWNVHPLQQTIHAYSAVGPIRLFQKDDLLTADPVLPDFRVPVAELFQLPAS